MRIAARQHQEQPGATQATTFRLKPCEAITHLLQDPCTLKLRQNFGASQAIRKGAERQHDFGRLT